MSDPATGQPGRDANGPSSGTRRAVGALAGLIAAGLALRLIIAYLLPGSGFAVDLTAFQFWAANLAQDGPWGFYDRPFFHDYTPGYLYVLWALGSVAKAVGGGLGDFVKLPAIVADLVCAWLVYELIRDLGGRERRALLGAALVLFIPITWFDSVVWGQVDSVGMVFVLLALRSTWRDQPEWAALWGTIAVLIKPQLGIVVPIIGTVIIRRALLGRPPDEAGLDPEPSAERRSWLGDGPIRIVTTALVGLATATALCAPFGLTLPGLVRQVLETAGGYPYVTVNAYNPWALVTDDTGRGLAATGTWLCDAMTGARCPEPLLLGPFWALAIGTVAILAAVGVIVVMVARWPDRRTILVGLAVIAIAFFVVPTRVHERYLYPLFIVGAILASLSIRWRVAWLALAVANFLNLYVVLTTIYPDNPSIDDWLGIGPAIRSPIGIALVAATHLLGFLWAVAQLRPEARWTLAEEVAEAGGRRLASVPEDETPAEVETGPPMPSPATGAMAAMAPGTGPPRLGGLVGLVASARRRLDGRAIRPDRSRGLLGERGGRFGRLDLWLLAILVVLSLSFRTFRLAEPYTMHFDEVYHARTATEFLQSWRYGIDHDIYEYTHPHLAKYAMAAGIILFGEDQVSATSDLAVPIRDAAIETRWDDPLLAGGRAGDRLYVATGGEVRAYDLATRGLVATVPAPGAVAVAISERDHRLYIGTDAGELLVLGTGALDTLREAGPIEAFATPDPLGRLDGPVTRLYATIDGLALVAATEAGQVVTVDATSGVEIGRADVAGVTQLADAGTGAALIARPADIDDRAAVAAELGALSGGAASDYESLLSSEAATVVIPGILDGTSRADVQAAIDDGRLAGLAIEDRARVAVAGSSGLTLLATADGTVVDTIGLEGGAATGVAKVSGVETDPRLYVSNGSQMTTILIGGSAADAPRIERSFPMPAAVRWVAFDEATQGIHVLGDRQDGAGSTIYVIEPHANSVYADAPLPVEPVAWALDAAKAYPSSDRQQLLTFAADGGTATVEVGRHPFSWRLPGVLAGVLAGAIVFLLARLLFARRAVAVALAAFVAVDPMLFVQSRIGMNDAYVGLFIVAAIAAFAALWTGRWRWRGAFWMVLPVVGVLLGLALASKWVGAYAIGAIGVLILCRSALGRLLLIVALIAISTVLGYFAVSAPGGATAGANLTFLIIMIGLTLAAVVATVLHPVAWSDEEVRFAVGAPIALGALVFLAGIALGRTDATVAAGPISLGLPALAFGLLALGGVVYLAFAGAGRAGIGPLAPPPSVDDPARWLPPASPPPPSWLRPGSLLGLPLVWMAVCLIGIPLGVYIVSYIPWALLDNHQLFPGWPAGHTGTTLADLTLSMYDYHDRLRATHAAASPWWAWPLDLKPVWFYQGSFAGGTSGAIYDHGSLVTWWLAIPAMGFVAFQAFRRRSLGLALIAIVFACLWLPWARIDRATFQYHWYTSLPFMLLALGYLVAELWHGPSPKTWLLVRVAAAVAVIGPVLLWLFKAPLCVVAGVEQVNPGSLACTGNPGELVLTTRVAGIAAIVLSAAAILVWQLVHLDRPDADGNVPVGRRLRDIVLTAVAAGVGVALASGFLGEGVILSVPGFQSEIVALLLGVPLAGVAYVVLTAGDARRFAIGAVLAAVAWTLVLYPNMSALPLPTVIVNAYQGILPTYLYPFQFAVNTDPAAELPPLFALEPLILGIAIAMTAIVVGYSAWVWRLSLAERDAGDSGPDADAGPGLARSGGAA